MHFNSRTRLLLVSLSIVVHLLAGCKKGTDNPAPPSTGSVSTTPELEKSNYKFYEIAVIKLKNKQSQNTILDATVGNAGVKIAVASDTTLVFSVWPTVYKEGGNTLNFTIDGKSYSLGINVQAALPVSDPELVFTTYKNSLIENVAYFDDLKRKDTTGILSDATVVSALAYAKEQISKLDNEWAALSAEQKLAVANFFQANDASLASTNQTLKELTDFLYQGGLTFRTAGYICATGTPVERYKCVAGTLAREAKNIVKWGAGAYLAAQTIPLFATPFPLLAGIPIAISVFCSTKAILSGLNFVHIGLQFLKINAKIVGLMVMSVVKDGLRVTGDPNTFYKDAAMPFPVKMTLRNVVAADASSPLTWLADLVNSINSYNSLCDEYPTAFGKYKLQFRNPVQKQFNLFRLQDISIKNISNPKVTGGTIGGTADAPTLKFSTKETTALEFSFDVVYDDKVNTPATISVSAKLLPVRVGVTVAGENRWGSAANQLMHPNGVFVDGSGNIYVSDEDNDRIQKWAPGATSGVTVAGGNGRGSAANQLNLPQGVCVDGSGNIYVADIYNERIQKWVPGASSGITVAGGKGWGSGSNQFNGPNGVFVDGSRNIYVADGGNYRIQKWAPGATWGVTVAGGNGKGSAANQFSNYPEDVFVDGSGNIYVSDFGNHRIQKWAPGASSGVTVAGGNGQGSAANQLSFPQSVFVDRSGNIYVADRGNHRIQMWAPGASSGVTVAGGNGAGLAADQLDTPSGVFLDAAGNIYIADYNNARVQKWPPF